MSSPTSSKREEHSAYRVVGLGGRDVAVLTISLLCRPRGKGREFEDLDVVMKRMEHWAHRLYPKLPFDSVLEVIANRLGKRKVI
jgi:hypothetical protein